MAQRTYNIYLYDEKVGTFTVEIDREDLVDIEGLVGRIDAYMQLFSMEEQ